MTLEYDILIKLRLPIAKKGKLTVHYGKHKASTELRTNTQLYSLPANFAKLMKIKVFTTE